MNEEISPVEAAAEPEARTTTEAPADISPARSSGLYELDLEGINGILKRGMPTVVAFAGEANAGKTSCLASLAVLLLDHALSGRYFAGGATLHGLAQMAMSVSIQGKVERPALPRTRRGGIRGQHLSFSATCQAKGLDLLVLDMAGEDYRLAVTGEAADLLAPIRRADVIVFFIDGARLLDESIVQDEIAFLTNLIRRITDNGYLDERARIVFAFTKTDCWETTKLPVGLRVYVEDRLRRLVDPSAVIAVLETAAVPEVGSTIDFGIGVEALFELILSQRAFSLPCDDLVGLPSTMRVPQYVQFGRPL